jgi:hypothetical protein
MLKKITNNLNYLFKNRTFRMFIFLFASVFLGYTLQPVPEWLNNIFDTSNIAKFLIIFTVGILSFYPLDKEEVKNIFIGTIITMVIFNYSRLINPSITQ